MLFHMGTTTPYRNLEEIKGAKVRSLTGELPAFEELGMTGVVISDMDMFTGMERGTLDIINYPCIGWNQ